MKLSADQIKKLNIEHGVRSFGGRKSNKEKEELRKINVLKKKRGKFIISFK